MAKYVFIEGDENDGDYKSQLTKIKKIQKWTASDIENLLKKAGKLIKSSKAEHNWAVHEYRSDSESPEFVYKDKLTEEEIEIIDYHVPHGVHSITTMQVLEISSITKLL